MSRVDTDVSQRVVEAVADYTDTDMLELPPLYDSVDPDALNKLIRSASDSHVTFEYAGYRITIDTQGAIQIDENSPPFECKV